MYWETVFFFQKIHAHAGGFISWWNRNEPLTVGHCRLTFDFRSDYNSLRFASGILIWPQVKGEATMPSGSWLIPIFYHEVGDESAKKWVWANHVARFDHMTGQLSGDNYPTLVTMSGHCHLKFKYIIFSWISLKFQQKIHVRACIS